MFSLLFADCLRVNELCWDKNAPNNTLQFNDVTVDDKQLIIQFRSYKHHTGEGPSIVVNPEVFLPLNPTSDFLAYLDLRGNHSGILMIDEKGDPVTRGWLVMILNRVLKAAAIQNNIKPHSFRIGCMNHLLKMGWSDIQIRRYGRWKSGAIYSYLR